MDVGRVGRSIHVAGVIDRAPGRTRDGVPDTVPVVVRPSVDSRCRGRHGLPGHQAGDLRTCCPELRQVHAHVQSGRFVVDLGQVERCSFEEHLGYRLTDLRGQVLAGGDEHDGPHDD